MMGATVSIIGRISFSEGAICELGSWVRKYGIPPLEKA
jgi:hypothetical protein